MHELDGFKYIPKIQSRVFYRIIIYNGVCKLTSNVTTSKTRVLGPVACLGFYHGAIGVYKYQRACCTNGVTAVAQKSTKSTVNILFVVKYYTYNGYGLHIGLQYLRFNPGYHLSIICTPRIILVLLFSV